MTAEKNKFACSFVSNLKGSELKGGLVAHDHHTQLLRQSTLFQSLHQKKKRNEYTSRRQFKKPSVMLGCPESLHHGRHVQQGAAGCSLKQSIQHACSAAMKAALMSSVHAQETSHRQGKQCNCTSLTAHRETDRQTGMRTDSQTGMWSDRHAHRQTYRQEDRHKQAGRQAGRQA